MGTSILRGIHILSEVSDADLEELEAYGNVVNFTDGQLVVKQDSIADALYFVLEGELAAFVKDKEGGHIHLKTIESGGHFGEIGVLEPGHRTASVVARRPCQLFRISTAAFHDLLKVPQLAVPVLHGLSRSLAIRLNAVTCRLAELSSLKTLWTL